MLKKLKRPLSTTAQEYIKNLMDAVRDEVLAVEHDRIQMRSAAQYTNEAASTLGEYVRKLEKKVRLLQVMNRKYRKEFE